VQINKVQTRSGRRLARHTLARNTQTAGVLTRNAANTAGEHPRLARRCTRATLNPYLNNLPCRSRHTSCVSAFRATSAVISASEFVGGTFLDISRSPERALALINFGGDQEQRAYNELFHAPGESLLPLAFSELARCISSRLSSYIEIRAEGWRRRNAHTDIALSRSTRLHRTSEAYLGGKLMKCKVFHIDYQLLPARCDMSALIS